MYVLRYMNDGVCDCSLSMPCCLMNTVSCSNEHTSISIIILHLRTGIVWDVDLDVDVNKDMHANTYLSCAPLFSLSCVNASRKLN